MSAHIKRLKTNPQKIHEQEYEQLRLVLAQYPQLDEQKVTSLLWDAKKKAGRGVIYYMNPNVANHYPQEIRNQKQKEAPQLKLLNGGLIKK